MKEGVLKAGRIPAGEELLGIGRIAASAKGPRLCELEVEQTVFAADRTVTAPARRYFCVTHRRLLLGRLYGHEPRITASQTASAPQNA
jgi:hypothetical protein